MRWGKGRNVSGGQRRNQAPGRGGRMAGAPGKGAFWGFVRNTAFLAIAWGSLMVFGLGDVLVCQAAQPKTRNGGLAAHGQLNGSSGRFPGILSTGEFPGGGQASQDAALEDGSEERWDLEGLDGLEYLDGLEGQEEVSDEELDKALEEYFRELDGGSWQQEDIGAEKITDPVLKMETISTGNFKYTLPNGNYFISSVPCGMISAGPVDLELPGGTVGLVQKDDVKEAFPDSWHFTERGVYYVRLLILQPPGDPAVDYSIYEVNFYFTIIGGTDNSLGAVPAPEGFAITGVRLDGKPQRVEQERCYFLRGDGYYEVEFEARGDAHALARTAFMRDTTAPFLSFSREMEPGGIPGEVEFYPSETGCRVLMHYNGNRGYAVSNRLTAAGNYELTVEDKAGNSRIYHVKLRQTYKLIDWRLIAAGAAAAVFAAVRLLMARRDMKVL